MGMRGVACGTVSVVAGLLTLGACASDDGASSGFGLVELACDDGKDQDSDGLTDCDDPDCEDTAACLPGAGGSGPETGSGGATDGGAGNIETSCTNRVDDDDDGDVDCDDSDCGFHPDCGAPPTGGAPGTGGTSGVGGAIGTGGASSAEYDCSNGVDDDDDGDTDCDDSDCAVLSVCGGPLTGACLLAAQAIALPTDTVTGALAATDPTDGPRGSAYYFDSYVFTASGGESVTFELTQGSFDTYLYLLDANCTELTRDDDGGSGLLSSITYTFDEAGTYVIVVTSYGSQYTGTYTLDVAPTTETSCTDGLDNDLDGYTDCADTDCSTDGACCTVGQCYCQAGSELALASDVRIGELTSSDPQNGPRGSSYYYDAYEFAGTSGQTVTFEITEGDFDTYLYLITPSCSTEASDDDGGSGLLSRISRALSYSGTYTIVVTSLSSSRIGTYTLTVGG